MATQETKTVAKSNWAAFVKTAGLVEQSAGLYMNRGTKLRVAITGETPTHYVVLVTRNCNC
jgi:hypothetical protein